jgi:dihydroorotate dehydrogenase (NAD+) catalytic subunit
MDLTIKIGNTKFKNPVWVASGTFGYGKEFAEFVNLDKVGAIVTKTITLNAREGNPTPRIVETPSGLLNSIGLENKGVEHFKKNYMPYLKKLDTKIVVSVAGEKKEEFVECVRALTGRAAPDAIELNLSCPNVKHSQTKYKLIAQDPDSTAAIIKAVKKITKKPIIAKLTPNVTDIAAIAKKCEKAGADAVALVNTYFGMAVDAETMKPVLGNVVGGLSGPAIKPMALKSVMDVFNNINIPIIGVGGIMGGICAAEFMLCGASAVQVGTANFTDPGAQASVLKELEAYLRRKKIKRAKDLIGKLEKGPK